MPPGGRVGTGARRGASCVSQATTAIDDRTPGEAIAAESIQEAPLSMTNRAMLSACQAKVAFVS